MDASIARVSMVQALIAREPRGTDAATGTAGWLQRLCRAAARELPASGVAVSLMTELGVSGIAAASDRASVVVEELQFSLGEGPCLDAFALRRPVLVPDLGNEATGRWFGYAPAVHAHGVRAVFAFPLQIGAARLGAMDVYRQEVGPLTVAVLSAALTFAEVATMMLLDGQERAVDGDTPRGLSEAMDSHYQVHQAQGMVMVQLGVSLTEAMSRLRAYAYSHDRGLGQVARDIVERNVSLERD